jgi:hypothetical protein
MKAQMYKTKICKTCKQTTPSDQFLTQELKFTPRASSCYACVKIWYAERLQKIKESEAQLLSHTLAYLYILWREFPSIYLEATPFDIMSGCMSYTDQTCLYCGYDFNVSFEQALNGIQPLQKHSDHMDALNIGGLDHLRNFAYSCQTCNAKKGSKNFATWFFKCPSERQELILQYYQNRHERHPSDFIKASPIPRDENSRRFLNERLKVGNIITDFVTSGTGIRILVDMSEEQKRNLPELRDPIGLVPVSWDVDKHYDNLITVRLRKQILPS